MNNTSSPKPRGLSAGWSAMLRALFGTKQPASRVRPNTHIQRVLAERSIPAEYWPSITPRDDTASDLFAAAALTGFLGQFDADDTQYPRVSRAMAEACYDAAEVMHEERTIRRAARAAALGDALTKATA